MGNLEGPILNKVTLTKSDGEKLGKIMYVDLMKHIGYDDFTNNGRTKTMWSSQTSGASTVTFNSGAQTVALVNDNDVGSALPAGVGLTSKTDYNWYPIIRRIKSQKAGTMKL